MPGFVEVVEVGPRDGLQSEDAILSTEDKLSLIRRVVAAGARRVEVASFVHPRLVPQMADAEAVAGSVQYKLVSTIGLVLNRIGLQRALATPVDEINFVAYAADGYSRHNANASAAQVAAEVSAMLPIALAADRSTSVTISASFGDPHDGEVSPHGVAELAARLVEAGAEEIALADTIGAAVPPDVTNLVAETRAAVPGVPLRCHFHNTRGTAMANAVAAVDAGVEALDAAVGGYGGSPFAPGAGGNLATEDLAYALDRMGIGHGLSLGRLIETAAWLEHKVGTPVKAMLGEAGPFPPEPPAA